MNVFSQSRAYRQAISGATIPCWAGAVMFGKKHLSCSSEAAKVAVVKQNKGSDIMIGRRKQGSPLDTI